MIEPDLDFVTSRPWPPAEPADVAEPARPATRVRIAHVLVQPVLVCDDGDDLTPGPPTQAVQVSVSDLAGLADRLRADVARMNAAASADDAAGT